MNGPRYIQANLDQALYRQRCYQIHQERLKSIEAKKEANLAKQQDQLRQKVRESKMRNHIFTYNEKNASINRENQVLMTKLIEISKGKWSSINPVKPPIPGYRPHSLNVVNRKLESERITSENHTLAKRILEKPSAINKRILDQNYVNQRKYQSIVRKSNKMKAPAFQGRVGHLPPIKIETAIGSKGFAKGKANSSTQSDMNKTAPLMEPHLLNENIQKVSQQERDHKEEESKELTQTQKSPRMGGKKKSIGSQKKKVGAYMADVSYSPRRQESKKSTSKRMKSKDNSEIQDDIQKALKEKKSEITKKSSQQGSQRLLKNESEQDAAKSQDILKEQQIQQQGELGKKSEKQIVEVNQSEKASSKKVVTAQQVEQTKQDPSEKHEKASQKEIASIKSEKVIQEPKQEEKELSQKQNSEKEAKVNKEEENYEEEQFVEQNTKDDKQETTKQEKREIEEPEELKVEEKAEQVQPSIAPNKQNDKPDGKKDEDEAQAEINKRISEKQLKEVKSADLEQNAEDKKAAEKDVFDYEDENREVEKKETSNLITAVQGDGDQDPKPSEDVEEPKED